MKKIIVLLLFLLIGCNNNSIKSNKTIDKLFSVQL